MKIYKIIFSFLLFNLLFSSSIFAADMKIYNLWFLDSSNNLTKFKDWIIKKYSYQVDFWNDSWNIAKRSYELMIDWRWFSDRTIIIKHYDLTLNCGEWEESLCSFSSELNDLVLPQDQVVDFVADTSSYIIDKPINTSWKILNQDWTTKQTFSNVGIWINWNGLTEWN